MKEKMRIIKGNQEDITQEIIFCSKPTDNKDSACDSPVATPLFSPTERNTVENSEPRFEFKVKP